MIGINDKIEVGGVVGILTKILLNKVVAFILDMCDPAFCVGASPFLVFDSVINPSFVGGSNSNAEAFLGGNNMVGAPVIQIINQGTLVGSNGMNEFARIVSGQIAGTYGLGTGGDF